MNGGVRARQALKQRLTEAQQRARLRKRLRRGAKPRERVVALLLLEQLLSTYTGQVRPQWGGWRSRRAGVGHLKRQGRNRYVLKPGQLKPEDRG